MRASRTIVSGTFFGACVEPGTFCGASIEPGTFHGATIEPGTFHGATIEPGTFHADGQPAEDPDAVDAVDRNREVGSRRTSESTAGPTSPDSEEEVDAKRK